VEKSVRRQEIIEVARSRFRKFGIRKTSMQEIAEDLGLSVGTLYLYFKSKDDVIVGCAERFADRHRSFAQELLASDQSATDKLRTYVIHRYRAVEETRVGSSYAAEIARAVIKLNPERFQEDDRWLADNILTILRQGVQSGEFTIAQPERDAEVFFEVVISFLPVAGLEPFRPPTEAKLLRVLDWFMEKWKSA
jgi:TetR/AcrR family transcriptional regulator, fatty acid metabolism regulator protein